MQILSKQITPTGELVIMWLSGNVYAEAFPAEQVQFFMYRSEMITDTINEETPQEDQVLTTEGWAGYIDFLQASADNTFCENIISSNVLSK